MGEFSLYIDLINNDRGKALHFYLSNASVRNLEPSIIS